MNPRHYLSSTDLDVAAQRRLLERAAELKKGAQPPASAGPGPAVGLLFEKPSTRTRVSFEVAVRRLGGHPVVLRGEETQLGRGETLQDTGVVLSRYLDALVVRTGAHERLEDLAGAATVPVVNALSDLEHPCQALADLMTVRERQPEISGAVIAYLGDGNNVCHSLLLAGALEGLKEIRVATPSGYEPDAAVMERAAAIGRETGTTISAGSDPAAAAAGASVLYTDVWVSMGQDAERALRLAAFRGFQLSEDLLALAAPEAIVLHCLPAHRGEEIAAEVIDGPSSAVWDQAENRMYVQQALLERLLGLGEPRT